MAKYKTGIAQVKRIEDMIFLIRGQRVMLDSDLARVCGVSTVRVVRALELSGKLAELEQRVSGHDESLEELFEAIRQLLKPAPEAEPKEMSFHVRDMVPPCRVRPQKRF